MIFSTILADPPWPYGNAGPSRYGSKQKRALRAAPRAESDLRPINSDNFYPSMSIADLKMLPVIEHVENKAHLYLWTTNAFMEEAHQIARAWGFSPKTILTWIKVGHGTWMPAMGTGHYYRNATEHIVFAVRGAQRLRGDPTPTAFLSRRLPHSVKPDYFYDLIEKQSPGPYLEMFARRRREGWSAWGNEVDSDITL